MILINRGLGEGLHFIIIIFFFNFLSLGRRRFTFLMAHLFGCLAVLDWLVQVNINASLH